MRMYRVTVTPFIGKQVYYYLDAENDVAAENEVEALWIERFHVCREVVERKEYILSSIHDDCIKWSPTPVAIGVFKETGTVDLVAK